MFNLKTIKIKEGKHKLRKEGNMWDLPVQVEVATWIEPGEVKVIDTGISMTLPKGYGAKIYSRSSLPIKKYLMIGNSVGIIEWDYSDSYKGIFYNFSKNPVQILNGEYLMQFEIVLLDEAPWWKHLLNPFFKFKFKKVDVITTTRKGLGSSNGYK
jgi:deoxyuridine 5'-triphosphate nucleotidohydrolase